jgi:hypothetical protein
VPFRRSGRLAMAAGKDRNGEHLPQEKVLNAGSTLGIVPPKGGHRL